MRTRCGEFCDQWSHYEHSGTFCFNFTMESAMELNAYPQSSTKKASAPVFQFLSRFVNGVMCHSHVPWLVTDILREPVVKSNQKDPTDSGNYRLTAVATSASKLLEKVIYSRNDRYLGISSASKKHTRLTNVFMRSTKLQTTIIAWVRQYPLAF